MLWLSEGQVVDVPERKQKVQNPDASETEACGTRREANGMTQDVKSFSPSIFLIELF
jgi:hypothetical protein